MIYPTHLTKGVMVFPQSEDSLSFSKAVLKKRKENTVTLVLSEVIKVSFIYTVSYLTILSMLDPHSPLQSALICLQQHCWVISGNMQATPSDKLRTFRWGCGRFLSWWCWRAASQGWTADFHWHSLQPYSTHLPFTY